MQIQEVNSPTGLKDLTITQKLAFLVESYSQHKVNALSQEKYFIALTGACFADLLIMKRISIVENRFTISDSKNTNYEYLNHFLFELATIGNNRTLLDTFPKLMLKAEDLEKTIKKELIHDRLLHEKREGLPFIGQKITYPENKNYLNQVLDEIRVNLQGNEDPSQENLYFISILETIGLLGKAFESKKELDYGQKRIESWIETDHALKLICRTVDNEIKLQDLKHMSYRKGQSGLFR